MVNPDFDTVFLEARELTDRAQREAYLDRVTAGRPGMRERLEARLADAEAAEAYFNAPTAARAAEGAGGEGPGSVIGRYRLLELIGEGGMGSVYLAQQREPVQRSVALKVIKLGMDTREVVARFEAERQTLATLDHPAIAKVLDGGTTDTGRPYFVMELVRGLPITRFCDERQLSTGARLQLFIAVCQAVQHAHHKGIIHRDLKPSNILVALDGDRPVPKIIDFGIAKATGQRLTDKTFFTHFREFIGSPAYMSPEQADYSVADIDTRSDIYSLGVLLYELLTGHPPFEAHALMAAGLEEIRRVIRETDPPKPSTRLSHLPDEERTSIAQARQVEPARLGKSLSGDLDWIVMKALEKDRTRRYDSASSLAEDLQRHLQGEAVSAAPPGAIYRLRKFARRHRLPLIAAALIAGTLVAATGFSIWQAVAARRAEREAMEGRAEAEAISALLVDVFRSPDPARDGRSITVAETLQRGAGKIEADPSIPPERRARLLATLGATASALGLPRDALPWQEQARSLYERHRGPEDPSTLSAMLDLARTYFHADRGREAMALNREVVRLRLERPGPDHPDTLTAMSNLANLCEAADLDAECLSLRETVLEKRRRVLGEHHPDTLLALNNLGVSLFTVGQRARAQQVLEAALTLCRRHLGPEDLGTIRTMQMLARSWHDAGRLQEARDLRDEVVRLRSRILGENHSDTLGAQADLISSHLATDRPDEALALSEKVLARCRESLGPTHLYTLKSADNHASCLDAAGRPEEARRAREELLDLLRSTLGPESLVTLKTMNLLAESHAKAGQQESALVLREASLDIRRRAYPPDHPDTLLASEDLAESYTTAGRHADARPLRESVLRVRRQHLPTGHPDTVSAMEALAATLEALGDADQAGALRSEARAAAPPRPPAGR